MQHLPYDYKVCSTIKALRQLRGIKQSVVADSLNIDQSTYSRIELGEITITPAQLKVIAATLKTSHFQILAIADAEENRNFKMTSLSELLVKFVLLFEGKNTELNFSEEELDFVVSKIRLSYKAYIKRKYRAF